MCMHPGLECYKSIKKNSDECLIPCTGIYADVLKNEDVKLVDEMKQFKTAMVFYKKYKSRFINGTEGN